MQRLLPCRPAALAAVLVIAFGLGALRPAEAAEIRVITDVWGGNGNGNIAAGCTTYAPIADLQTYFGGGGFRVLGGNAACGYTGVTSDQRAPTGALLSNQTLPPVALDTVGSSFQGKAAARASFGALGVSAQGQLTGTTDGTSAVVATGAAWFQDTLTATSPQVAPSSAGFVRYIFNLDGSLSGDALTHGGASVQLSLRQSTGPVYDLGRVSANGGELGVVRAIDSDTSGWVLGAGAVMGAGVFGSTVHVPFFGDVDLPMVWGSPWEVQVGLLATIFRTADADFMSTAELVDIQLFDAAHVRVTDFTLNAASGTDYLAAPPQGVPAPPSWALLLLGIAILWRRTDGARR
jgi:hypothetical protein